MCSGIFSIWLPMVLFPITAALFSPRLSGLSTLCFCAPVHTFLTIHSQHIDLTLRLLCAMSNTIFSPLIWWVKLQCRCGQSGVKILWSLRFPCLKVSCFMSLRLSLTEFNLHFVCACACMFYKPLGMSLCYQIWDIDQHAFERGRTSMKWIVPVHLPQHSLYEGTICWLVYDGEFERRA